MTARKSRGFSLPELLLVSALFSGFLLVAYTMLNRGVSVWQKTESSQDATLRLAQARQSLERDLQAAAFDGCKVAVKDGSGFEGQCLWFLSAADEQTGELARNADGAPLWQRNILYYLARPQDHVQAFGQNCQDAPQRCPHKFLIRRVFDLEADPNKVEPLMTDLQALNRVRRPQGYNLGLEGPKSTSNRLIATGMLGIAVTRGVGAAPEIEILLSAFGVEDAGKKVPVGREDLSKSSFTRYLLFSVYPGNPGS